MRRPGMRIHRLEGNSFTGYVKDSGPGIPPEDQEKLFQPGVQLESEAKGLAGLGLYSVKSVVEAQGGEVWVESALGQGSRFFFTIPVDKAPSSPPIWDGE